MTVVCNTKKVTVFRGDKRYVKLCELFNCAGYDAAYTTNEKLSTVCNSDIIIFPITAFDSEGNINGTDHTVYDLFSSIHSNSIIFAGKVPAVINKIAAEYKIKLYDYTVSEEFSQLNAIPSAEGAILTLLEKANNTISGSFFTVFGYGRIGKALATRLRLLGGNVKIGARSSVARAKASCDAMNSYTIENAILNSKNVLAVFNTVPSPIINESNVQNIKNSIFIDLASIPGGVTDNAKKALGENYIHALSLPGKHFPDTAGEIIFKTINSILFEKG